jgi:hypothetical protein
MAYREELIKLARDIENTSKDLRNYAYALENLANKIYELERENSKLKAGK